MIGHVVGSYRIVSRLGAGGMGTVWLAEHTLLGRRVAIKFLHADISRNASTVERFFAEARAATRISDPGIVVVYDFGWHTNADRSAYIVMEYLDGETLAARLATAGRLPLVQAIHAIEQAAMAMAVAHAAGIIHRDLKPDNIFVIPDPVAPGGERIKLLDFGIAKLVGDSITRTHARTHTGLIMGTPMYMSPEQCRGAGDVDHRTDIYALGCVFFHLVCGREPFMAITPGDLIAAHLREPALAPSIFTPALPASIDRIILRCLAKSPDERYASMTELVRDLRAAVGLVGPTPTIAPLRAAPQRAAPTATPLSTLGTSAGESLPRPPPRRRRVGLTLAVVLASAIGATIGVAITRQSPTAARRHTTSTPHPPPHEGSAHEPPLPAPPAPPAPRVPATPDITPTLPASARTPPPSAKPPSPAVDVKPPPPVVDVKRRPRTPDPLERR